MRGRDRIRLHQRLWVLITGRVAVTGSSGPGISLKTEALGWGIMAEIPLIVVDVQRGGPSTGMPTNVEQSDLNIACFGGHGDARGWWSPLPMSKTVSTPPWKQCASQENTSMPVIILTDQAIATRIEAFGEPDLQSLCKDITPDLSPVEDHKPYDLNTENGITHHLAPGTPIESGKYPVVTGLEHDEMGHPTGSPKLHVEMNAKRRKKLQALGASLEVPEVYGNDNGKVLLVGWGSTQGPIQENHRPREQGGHSVVGTPSQAHSSPAQRPGEGLQSV